MSTSKKSNNIAEQFAILSNPTPQFEDPEDEDFSYSRAQLDDQYDEDDDKDLSQPSSLRQRNASLLESTDKKYSGKTVSRKELQIDSDDSLDGDSLDDTELLLDPIDIEFTEDNTISSIKCKQELIAEGSEEEDEVDNYEEEGTDEEEHSNEENDESEGSDEEGDESSEEDNSLGVEEEEDEMLKPFSNQDLNEEIQKGNAAKAQLGLWDNFMEIRIKVQKALSMSNQMPQNDSFPQIKAVAGKELIQIQNKAKQELSSWLDMLINLQEALLLQNPETKHVIQGGKPKAIENDEDEEITSDDEIPSDDEKKLPSKKDIHDDEEEEEETTKPAPSTSKKRRLQDYEDILAKRHKNFTEYRNQTLQKWHDKTKVSSGKLNSKSFSSFDRSVLKQIDEILVDQDRLVKRTQLKRTMYNVIAKKEEEENEMEKEKNNEDIPVQQNQHLKDYDVEIFDDDDFYHQLLRELIEKRTAGSTDPTQLTRQWLEVQKLRSKVRKKVDTKASKGRKIRYDVHQKLVSFMAADETCSLSHESRTELYKSLFGQKLGKADNVTR